MKISGILASVFVLTLLAGCGEDAPEKVNPLEATKWLSDNGYTVNKEGLERAIDKFDERAIRYLGSLDDGGKKFAGDVFVITVGSCKNTQTGWFYKPDECRKLAKLLLDAGVPLDYRRTFNSGDRGAKVEATVFNVLELSYEDIFGSPFTRDSLAPEQAPHYDEFVKARPAVLEYLKDRQN